MSTIRGAWVDEFAEPEFNTYDYPIGGKMIVAKVMVSELETLTDDKKQFFRERLVQQIASAMLKEDFVEFTQIQDPISLNTIVRARCYLAPNDQIKILRTAYKIDK